MHICIEGADGAGKNTQAKILAHRMRAELYSFPRYNTPIGKLIKRHLVGDVALREEHFNDARRAPEDALMFRCLMAADKLAAAQSMRDLLSNSVVVVCDRWIPSSLCYGAADGIDREWLKSLYAALPQADLNIFLDVTLDETLRRRPEARDRYERDQEKQLRVREEYKRLWADEGAPHYVTVDGDGGGSGDGPIFTVAERVWAAVETYRRKAGE